MASMMEHIRTHRQSSEANHNDGGPRRKHRKVCAVIGLLILLACLFIGGAGSPMGDALLPDAALLDLDNMHVVLPTASNVKMLGRTYEYKDAVWCALSGSGIEFYVTGTACAVTIQGDEMAEEEDDDTHQARIGIFLNDELVVDDMLTEPVKTYTVFQSGEITNAVIRVIKLSESVDSTMGIRRIVTDANEIYPTAEKSLKIEYIGDSITSGYGGEGKKNDKFKTYSENVTKSYAYLSAQELDADYSIVSYRGYGVLSGHTSNGKINVDKLVPPIYDKMGRSRGSFAGELALEEIPWDFSRFVPDIVVVNLGTNDASYCYEEDQYTAFQQMYTSFLKKIRQKNPKAVIICSVGIMGDEMFGYIEAAVAEYETETGDFNVHTFHFSEQDPNNGYGSSSHPSEFSQQIASDQLVQKIEDILNHNSPWVE